MFTTHINIEGKIAMDNLILTVLLDMAKKLDNGCGIGHEGAELHDELCNQTQFFEDSDDAKKCLGEHAFDAIRLVKEWEEAHIGEVHTNFSCPCCVANMFAYCVGEYALCYSTRLEGRWENELNQEDLNCIRDEIARIEPDNLLEMHVDTYECSNEQAA